MTSSEVMARTVSKSRRSARLAGSDSSSSVGMMWFEINGFSVILRGQREELRPINRTKQRGEAVSASAGKTRSQSSGGDLKGFESKHRVARRRKRGYDKPRVTMSANVVAVCPSRRVTVLMTWTKCKLKLASVRKDRK